MEGDIRFLRRTNVKDNIPFRDFTKFLPVVPLTSELDKNEIGLNLGPIIQNV